MDQATSAHLAALLTCCGKDIASAPFLVVGCLTSRHNVINVYLPCFRRGLVNWNSELATLESQSLALVVNQPPGAGADWPSVTLPAENQGMMADRLNTAAFSIQL